MSGLCGRATQWLRPPVLHVFVFLEGTTLKTVSGFLLRLSGSLKIPRHEIMIFAISDTDKHVSTRRVTDSELPRFNRALFTQFHSQTPDTSARSQPISGGHLFYHLGWNSLCSHHTRRLWPQWNLIFPSSLGSAISRVTVN